MSSRVREKISYFAFRTVRLRADAIILVFDEAFCKIAERLFGRFSRAGQHESQGMEQPHLRLAQLARGASFSVSPMSPSSMFAR